MILGVKIKMKKTILIDLDGVLNTYTGEYNEDYIPSIKDGAFEFLKELSKDYIIKIFTSRSHILVSEWIIKNNLKEYIIDVTNVKEPNYLLIDDRCINFQGDFSKLVTEINKFKTWYK